MGFVSGCQPSCALPDPKKSHIAADILRMQGTVYCMHAASSACFKKWKVLACNQRPNACTRLACAQAPHGQQLAYNFKLQQIVHHPEHFSDVTALLSLDAHLTDVATTYTCCQHAPSEFDLSTNYNTACCMRQR